MHDKEKAHGPLVRKLGLESEAYDSREISKLPDKDNPLREANRLCFLLKAFLERHNGFDRDRLPDWPDLFHVIMNPPDSKLEKAALVLDCAMASPKTLRYRDLIIPDRIGTCSRPLVWCSGHWHLFRVVGTPCNSLGRGQNRAEDPCD